MKPIIMVILMSAGIMYLLLQTTGNAGSVKEAKARKDRHLAKKIFSKDPGIHEMLINQLLW